jgi:predicted AlkP superfamily phosphohydrolase/phosphomutase
MKIGPSTSAYIDPGSAGLPFQNLGPFLGFLAGLLAAVGFFFKSFWRRFRGPLLGLLALLVALSLLYGFSILSRKMSPARVIVIGMDGVDHGLLRRWMDAGALPNFAKLAGQGSFLPLETVVPPQSPVAWCTFATGANPGVHGVFDFLQRAPASYYPHLTLNKASGEGSAWGAMPFEKVRAAAAFWELTSARRVPTVVLRHPVTFPPEPVEGRMLSGLGVPDLSGGLGRYAFYAAPPFRKPADFRGELVELRKDGAGWTGAVPGPKSADGKERPSVPLRVEVSGGRARVKAGREEFELAEGEWSPWARLPFRLGTLKTVESLSRFHLLSAEPLRLYQTPLNFDPEAPAFAISHPPSYAKDLAKAIGPFYTLGMDEDTNALSDGSLTDEAFLAQCRDISDQRDAMLAEELKTFKSGLLVCVYDTPDRVQHMFWRAQDPDHPAHAGSEAHAGAILAAYKRLDETLGKVWPAVDERTLLVVASDHGFAPFRRAVHLNRWLAENGYLSLKDPAAAPEDFFQGVDWSKTRAYSLGLGGGIYLNRKGREPSGIVEDKDADALLAEIADKLKGWKDGGAPVVARAAMRKDVFSGPLSSNSPDLMAMLKPGYRVSWQTALGGVPKKRIEDHASKWSGDHACNAPEDVPGVLLANRKISEAKPRLSQVAPTFLKFLGVDPASGMDAPLTLEP